MDLFDIILAKLSAIDWFENAVLWIVFGSLGLLGGALLWTPIRFLLNSLVVEPFKQGKKNRIDAEEHVSKFFLTNSPSPYTGSDEQLTALKRNYYQNRSNSLLRDIASGFSAPRTAEHDIKQVIDGSLDKFVHLQIIGERGCGKSTLLGRAALALWQSGAYVLWLSEQGAASHAENFSAVFDWKKINDYRSLVVRKSVKRFRRPKSTPIFALIIDDFDRRDPTDELLHKRKTFLDNILATSTVDLKTIVLTSSVADDPERLFTESHAEHIRPIELILNDTDQREIFSSVVEKKPSLIPTKSLSVNDVWLHTFGDRAYGNRLYSFLTVIRETALTKDPMIRDGFADVIENTISEYSKLTEEEIAPILHIAAFQLLDMAIPEPIFQQMFPGNTLNEIEDRELIRASRHLAVPDSGYLLLSPIVARDLLLHYGIADSAQLLSLYKPTVEKALELTTPNPRQIRGRGEFIRYLLHRLKKRPLLLEVSGHEVASVIFDEYCDRLRIVINEQSGRDLCSWANTLSSFRHKPKAQSIALDICKKILKMPTIAANEHPRAFVCLANAVNATTDPQLRDLCIEKLDVDAILDMESTGSSSHRRSNEVIDTYGKLLIPKVNNDSNLGNDDIRIIRKYAFAELKEFIISSTTIHKITLDSRNLCILASACRETGDEDLLLIDEFYKRAVKLAEDESRISPKYKLNARRYYLRFRFIQNPWDQTIFDEVDELMDWALENRRAFREETAKFLPDYVRYLCVGRSSDRTFLENKLEFINTSIDLILSTSNDAIGKQIRREIGIAMIQAARKNINSREHKNDARVVVDIWLDWLTSKCSARDFPEIFAGFAPRVYEMFINPPRNLVTPDRIDKALEYVESGSGVVDIDTTACLRELKCLREDPRYRTHYFDQIARP